MTIEAGTVNLTATGGYTNINGINNASCQFIGGGSAMYLDFHSYNGTPTAFDGRIRCDGADGTTQGGTMQYLAKKHDFDGLVNFWNGMRFQKGNLTSAFYIQTGTVTMTTVLGAGNAMTPVYQAFPTQWGGATAPKVQLTLWTNNVAAAMGIIVSLHSVSTSGFNICMYNARSTNAAANAYGVHWTATGSW